MQGSDSSSGSDASSNLGPRRYVLVYSVDLVPEGVTIVPHSRTGPECCESFGSWSDPHLVHQITLHCYRCKMDTRVPLTAGSSTPDEMVPEEMNHLVRTCPNQCREPTKVRILRRGWKTVIPDRTTPILEVEVIGDLDGTCEENVSQFGFNLYCMDDTGGQLYPMRLQSTDDDGSRNFMVLEENGNRVKGYVRGFKAEWQHVPWTDQIYDTLGLRIVDQYNTAKEGWPPEDWTSGEEDDEEEKEEGAHGGSE